MRILWHSVAPFVGTGYGQQTAMFVPRIKAAGHEVAISAIYGVQGAMLDWNGIVMYPTDHTNFGKAMLPFYVGHYANGDMDPRDVLVVTLTDVWFFNDHADKLAKLRLASWVPVDHDPLPPEVEKFFRKTGSRPIAMSRFGESRLRAAGLDPLYVPHGVDTTLFRPVADAAETRRAMGIPEDAFVVGMVANNQGITPPRKAFPQVFEAFSRFRQSHPDAFLYLHADIHGLWNGLKLSHLAEICGLPPGSYGCSDQLLLHVGFPTEQMPHIYSTFDVLASPSYGEGFGVPIIEAQACGVPVIVTDWTSMPELCGAGWKVTGDRWFDPHQGSWFMCPSVDGIVDALEQAHEVRGDSALRETAVGFASAYDADVVMENYWKPALAALDAPREVAPLREMVAA